MPAMILLHIPFLPVTIGLIVALCMFGSPETIYASISVGVIYLIIITFILITSLTKKYRLIEADDGLEITYPMLNNNKGMVKLQYTQILQVGYYKITSLKGWICPLYVGNLPEMTRSVYLKYKNEKDIVVFEHIGYMNKGEVIKVFKEKGINVDFY